MNEHATEKCDYEHLLPYLVENLLTENDRQKIDIHLQTCISCRNNIELMRRSLMMARAIWQDDWERYVNSPLPKTVEGPRRMFWRSQRLYARHQTTKIKIVEAAAAILLLAAGIGLLWHPIKGPEKSGSIQDRSLSMITSCTAIMNVNQEEMAARLLASAELMKQHLGLQEQAKESLDFVSTYYGSTRVFWETLKNNSTTGDNQ